MKKIMMILMAAMMVGLSATAREMRIAAADLPPAAQLLVEKTFGKNKIHHAKVDRGTFGSVEYEVILKNGTEIEFDKQGALVKIDCGDKGVPDELVPTNIREYMKNYFPKQKIVEMEVERNRYEITLRGGTELIFDATGRFIKLND